jgi:hypothetical protein
MSYAPGFAVRAMFQGWMAAGLTHPIRFDIVALVSVSFAEFCSQLSQACGLVEGIDLADGRLPLSGRPLLCTDSYL